MDTAETPATINQIAPSELLPLRGNNSSVPPVGSGTYGDCVLRTFQRFGIAVIEKLPSSNLKAVMHEAHCMNALTHPSIPHLLGVQIETKPFSLIMQLLGEGEESATVHKLLYQGTINDLSLHK